MPPKKPQPELRMVPDILVGADPELFVTENNQFRSAYGLIPGTKAEPFPVDNGAVQVDGLALEFNIAPAQTAEHFVENINSMLMKLREIVPANYHLSSAASAKFAPEYLAAQPYEALLLGCDPDFNAYTMAPNPPPEADPVYRVAGGHVHVGWTKDADIFDKEHRLACASLVKYMDLYLGVPSINFDDDKIRRKWYGKAGAFRPKPYGVEYRVLSNFWIGNAAYMHWVFTQTKKAFAAYSGECADLPDYRDPLAEFEGRYKQTPQTIIDNMEQYLARDFTIRYGAGV